MHFLRISPLVIIALIILGAFGSTNAAQVNTTCPPLIEKALQSVGNNCQGLNRNSACYGFSDVKATFSQTTTAETFTQPSDRAGLSDLKNIATSPLDSAFAKWGIALMSVQANLPDTLPGQNVVFMLLGDTQVENAVKPDAAFGGGTTLQVTTSTDAAQFYLPDTSQRIVGTVPAQTQVSADAVSSDSGWVRVVFDSIPGWISKQTLDPAADVSTLPTFSGDTHTSMQSFYLRTGITGTKCTQAPDSLIVQGPQHLMVDINANGADIRLGSTIALRLVPLTRELADLFRPVYPKINQVTVLLEVDVIDGHAILNPGQPDQTIVNTGYFSLRCLSDPANLGLDGVTNDRQVFAGCPWLQPASWKPLQYNTYGALNGVDLNYPIIVPQLPTPTPTRTPRIVHPTRTPTRTMTPTPTPTCTPEIIDNETFPCKTTEPTQEVTAEVTDTPTPTYTDTATDTDTPTNTDTPTDTDTPTSTFTPTDTPTDTPTPTNTLGG